MKISAQLLITVTSFFLSKMFKHLIQCVLIFKLNKCYLKQVDLGK